MRSNRDPDERPTARQSGGLRALLTALMGVYAIGWLLAVIGISRDMRLPIDERWAGSAMLFLEGGIALLWIARAYSWARALAVTAIVVPLAFAAEFTGVTVGFPFGRYHYTDMLVPTILGHVPAPIACAWLMIAVGSLTAARAITNRSRYVTVVVSALLATGLDGCLEPTAYHVKGYWLWETTGPYYGIPLINFAGWFVTALLINTLAAGLLSHHVERKGSDSALIPLLLFWSTVLMFAIIDLVRGYPGGAALGALLCVIAVPTLCRALADARHRSGLSTPPAREDAIGSSSPE